MLAGLAALTSPAANFTENFDGAVSGDRLGEPPTGTSLTVESGKVVLGKAANKGNAKVSLATCFH